MLTEERRSVVLARRAGAVLLISTLVAAGLLFVTLFLTMTWWKAAVALLAAIFIAAPWLWSYAPNGSWIVRTIAGAAAAIAIVIAVVVWPYWASHRAHDERLARMVEELCRVELPEGTIVERCGGSITNTGNGNSCRYLATTTVEPRVPAELEAMLEEQGFGPTSVDAWGDPTGDGKTYRRIGGRYELAYQASSRPQENDLRCT